MNRPNDYSLSSVKSWVCTELNYSGRKAEMANGSSEKALEWWTREGYLKFGALSENETQQDSAKKACRKYVQENYRYGNPLVALIFSILVQVVISAIAQIIIDWLFSDSDAAEHFGKFEHHG